MNKAQEILAGLAAAILMAGAAAAQIQGTANRLGTTDSFVTKAMQGGLAEVQMGQLALQHASSDKVKQFGQRMIDDHSKANEELRKIATMKGITVPSTVDSKDKATMDRLAKLSGAEFDRVYMRDMVSDHRTDVAEFKHESQHGADAEVKAFASKTLPTLEEHLKMAEEMEKQVK